MNMLTKIAMAIHAPYIPAEYREMEWLRSSHAEQERAILRAHAVLVAMREPTPVIIVAGKHAQLTTGNMFITWQTMIDAAGEE